MKTSLHHKCSQWGFRTGMSKVRPTNWFKWPVTCLRYSLYPTAHAQDLIKEAEVLLWCITADVLTVSVCLFVCVFVCLFNEQAGLHHGRVELAHLGGEHPGLPHRRRLCFICLGNVFHRAWNHHCLLRDSVLLLPGWKSVVDFCICLSVLLASVRKLTCNCSEFKAFCLKSSTKVYNVSSLS